MQVYSLNLANKDFVYEINYNNDGDDLTLCTNEEALSSLPIAIKTIEDSIKKYFELENYIITLQRIVFGEDDRSDRFKYSIRTGSKWPAKEMICNTSIPKITEKEPSEERQNLSCSIAGLLDEVEKYLRGERAQGTLDI